LISVFFIFVEEGRTKVTLIERLLISLGIAPKPLFDVVVPTLKAKAIYVANKLRIFDKLSSQWLSAQELAREISVEERSLLMLLEALAAVGYLRHKNGKYTNARVARQWLVEGSAKYVGNFLRHSDDLWKILDGLGQSVRTDKSFINFFQYCREHPDIQRNFILANKDIAVTASSEVVSKVKVPAAASRLLDLGGAHGYYSIAFCRKYPQLTALVVDWEKPVQIGQEVVNLEKMSERVAFKVADYMTEDIGSDYDIALLFALFHSESPEINQATLKKVYSALNPGATVAIAELLTYKGKKESELGLLFALNMLVNTPRGEAYSHDEVSRWLVEAGFTSVNQVDLRRLPGYSLVLASKPT
jgi:hypothetical protein